MVSARRHQEEAATDPHQRRKSMDDPNTTTGTLDQADEEILTYTVSDKALEAAAGAEKACVAGQYASICSPLFSPSSSVITCPLGPQ
jgi:hypothetical protein